MQDSKTTILQEEPDPQEKNAVRSFRCSDELWLSVRKSALDRGISTQDLVVEALNAYLEAGRA